jgi:hypothetical protein
MTRSRNILTFKLQRIKIGARRLQNTKFYALLIALVVLAGTFFLSPAISSLMNSVIIESTGQILIDIPTITAKSGYWRDIRNAADTAAVYGIANVYIPEGTFNFVNVSESWTGYRVTIPAGVSLLGAPTEKYANGTVIEWKTVLQIPWEAGPARPNYNTMFRFLGNGDPNKPSRFSDIKVVGYREFEPTSDRWYSVVRMYNIINFRVDHCFFKNTAGIAVDVKAPANGNCCGVIDHCKLINDYGYVEWYYADCSVHYGIAIGATGTTRWEDDITKVVGQYTSYTVFIEDCYFSRWRHCVCAGEGAHYVFRNNIIEKDSVVGSLDGHGTYNRVGTRAMEIYDNQIIDPVINKHPQNWNSTTPSNGEEGYGINWRGGGGVFFNNLVRGYEVGEYLLDEGEVEKCWPNQIYLWNNSHVNCRYSLFKYSDYRNITGGVHYFLYKPEWYTPYPYPHPLTIEKP